MKIKLCGIRTVSDALLCAEEGADEIGVVFAEKSRRRVTVAEAQAIRAAVPRALPIVGVFQDASAREIAATVRDASLAAAQVHGAWPTTLDFAQTRAAARAGEAGPTFPLYAALQVDGEAALARLAAVPTAARVLLDGPAGGSGKSFAWSLARRARSLHRGELFVAGGLTPENVADAIAAAAPDGVDVASGIENENFFKDRGRVRAFIQAARSAR